MAKLDALPQLEIFTAVLRSSEPALNSTVFFSAPKWPIFREFALTSLTPFLFEILPSWVSLDHLISFAGANY